MPREELDIVGSLINEDATRKYCQNWRSGGLFN